MYLVKYPRTPHLPWSNPSKDDKIIEDLSGLEGEEVVVTVKMDGENCNMYRDYIHARSLEPLSGETSSFVKVVWSLIKNEIPEGWRICGENLQIVHSIKYTNLPSYFLVFSIWDENNNCLAWESTLEWVSLLGLYTVPILYIGIWDEAIIKGLYKEYCLVSSMEGYVVRDVSQFSYSQFQTKVAKYVRPNHVTTDKHWKFQAKEYNNLGDH